MHVAILKIIRGSWSVGRQGGGSVEAGRVETPYCTLSEPLSFHMPLPGFNRSSKIQRSAAPLLRSRVFSLSPLISDKIVAAVLFERLPIIIHKIDPAAFQEFLLRWKQQHSRRYLDEVIGKSDARGRGDYPMDFVPAP